MPPGGLEAARGKKPTRQPDLLEAARVDCGAR